MIGRCALKNDPRSFDFQLSTTFGRGVKVVHTIFGHDFWPKMTFTFFVLALRHMCPGYKTCVSWLEFLSWLEDNGLAGYGGLGEWSWNGRPFIFTLLTKVIDTRL